MPRRCDVIGSAQQMQWLQRQLEAAKDGRVGWVSRLMQEVANLAQRQRGADVPAMYAAALAPAPAATSTQPTGRLFGRKQHYSDDSYTHLVASDSSKRQAPFINCEEKQMWTSVHLC